MSRDQQKAASERIMAKFPLTGEEYVGYQKLTMKPEEYGVPGESRVCGDCGALFQDIPGNKETPMVTALQQFADHTAVHNPSPAQWAEAHKRIEFGKASLKESM